MGRDSGFLPRYCRRAHFNPRARVGRDVAFRIFAQQIVGFQSTRPRGARPFGDDFLSRCGKFQSTRPRGARPCAPHICRSRCRFQSTRPRGARLRLLLRRLGRCSISIHAPAWGATGSSWMLLAFWIFQSTRPHGGATLLVAARKPDAVISIHAPSWGATLGYPRREDADEISIHAPSWGATGARHWKDKDSADFNPRALVGRDYI